MWFKWINVRKMCPTRNANTGNVAWIREIHSVIFNEGILTNSGRDKMAAIFQTTFSNAFFLYENVWISNTISLKFVSKSPIDNDTALVQIMAWRRTGDKPLSEQRHMGLDRPEAVNKIYLLTYLLTLNK